MSAFDPGTIVVAVITVLGGGALALMGKRGDNKVAAVVAALNEQTANRATEVESRRVDGEAYDRAEKITEQALTRLQSNVLELRATVNDQQSLVAANRAEIAQLRTEHAAQLAAKDAHIEQIERMARHLQRQVNQLRAYLVQEGMNPDNAYDTPNEGGTL